ncbi:unnamed protein product [Vitrella brassicaformis CCMP3155]|uniref:GH16 domain-containing protein n=1 Tax=Vitrella brassicaformis (strain CCMP3155) TaxID=1169540 RepID=A0A0G4GEY6_VITBC|nr:unnamed protein product [Vitrella brassicaformis CCMP3155]|eukprot:CEM28033.1 unnamed protein product [Vitrella brassicaformis CCMP3155]
MTDKLDSSCLPEGYQCVLYDDFQSDGVDRDKWDFRLDTSKVCHCDAECVGVAKGACLKISLLDMKDLAARRRLTTTDINTEQPEACDESPVGGNCPFAGGGIVTKQAFKHGYFEMRARMWCEKGWHQAFWLTTSHDLRAPASGPRQEIDIVETRSGHKSMTWNLHRWMPRPHEKIIGKCIHPTPDLSKDFHTWGLLWTDSELVWYFDGQETGRVDLTAVPIAAADWTPQYVWVTAISLETTYKDIDTKKLPGCMEVAYVKIYQKQT